MGERISIVSDEISQDLAEVRTFLDAHDLHAVELRCVAGERVPEVSAADLAVLEGWARAAEPRILAVSPGLFKCELGDRKTTRHHLECVLPQSVELAVKLGAPYLIAFTFEHPEGAAGANTAADALGRAADACRAAGITLLIENEPGFVASTPDEILEVLRAVDHPNIFVNWDALNSNVVETADLSAGLDRIFPHVRNVHVKNGVRQPDELLARGCRLRDGAIDWGAHLERLAWLGYDGWLGVETHFEPVMEGSALVLQELRDLTADLDFPLDSPLDFPLDSDGGDA